LALLPADEPLERDRRGAIATIVLIPIAQAIGTHSASICARAA
jgi:hypothetical protein